MGDTTFVGGDACFLVAVVLLIRALPLPLRGLRDDLLLLEIGPPIIIMTGVGEEEVVAFNNLLLLLGDGDELSLFIVVVVLYDCCQTSL